MALQNFTQEEIIEKIGSVRDELRELDSYINDKEIQTIQAGIYFFFCRLY